MNKSNRGITLIALVITIIILLILAGVTIYLMNDNIVDKAIMSKFVYNLRAVEERVELEKAEGEIKKIESGTNDIEVLPIKEKLTKEEKEKIVTLANKIKELNQGKLEEVELYWIDKEKIKIELEHDYIIDKVTGQVYDYQGEKIGNKVWHVIEEGQQQEDTNASITIKVDQEQQITTKVKIAIEYKNLTINKYRIGTEEMGIWKEYNGEIEVSSYDIIEQSLQNSDNSLTIYAKGTNSEGKEIVAQKTIRNMDIDIPKKPHILNGALPTIKLTGVEPPIGKIRIEFDTREDITNYYSTDNGTTWKEYTGDIDLMDTIIIAKSVKKNSKLEISEQQKIAVPARNIGPEGYDKDENTYSDIYYNKALYARFNVDKEVRNRNIIILADMGHYTGACFMNKEGNAIAEQKNNNAHSFENGYYYWGSAAGMTGKYIGKVQVPEDATDLTFVRGSSSQSYTFIYEVKVDDEPLITAKTEYMKLYSDSSKNIKEPYSLVTIGYLPTSPQKRYKIGEYGEWRDYPGEAIKLTKGQKIYAKAVDEKGNESKIVEYTATLTEAISKEVLDGDENTYFDVLPDIKYSGVGGKIKLDTSVRNKKIVVTGDFGIYTGIGFLDRQGNAITTVTENNAHVFEEGRYYWGSYAGMIGKYKAQVQVPENATDLTFVNGASSQKHTNIYEVTVQE